MGPTARGGSRMWREIALWNLSGNRYETHILLLLVVRVHEWIPDVFYYAEDRCVPKGLFCDPPSSLFVTVPHLTKLCQATTTSPEVVTV